MTATIPTLRPLSLGELLDQSFRLYRRNFLKFTGIIALVSVPLNLLSLIFSASGLFILTPESTVYLDSFNWIGYFAYMGGAVIVTLLTFVVVNGFGAAALTRAVADTRLGIETGVFSAYRNILSRIPQILIAVAIGSVIYMVLFTWMIVPCAGWVSGPVLFLFWTNVLWPLMIPVIVIERKNALTAIRRAWDLARRRFWWVLGFLFVLYLLVLVLTYGPSSVAKSLASTFIGSRLGSIQAEQVALMVQASVTALISVFVLPIQLIATILMYFDLRVRTEGLDLVLQTSESSGSVSASDLLASAPDARSDTLMTGREAGYFLALMLIFSLVVAILFFGILAISSLLFGGF